MNDLTDENLLRYIDGCDAELSTLAEYHKHLLKNNVICSIEELRSRIALLYRDGYLGNEPTGDGVNMYYLVFCPEKTSNKA